MQSVDSHEMSYLFYDIMLTGNGLYLQAVPPPMDNPNLPWKIIVGGPIPGAAERFRYTKDGHLYSHLMSKSNPWHFFVLGDTNLLLYARI